MSQEQEHDPIVRPGHYSGTHGIECLEAIRNMLTPEQYVGFLRGNQLKYLWRFARKNGVEDLQKANQLGEWLLEEIRKGCE
jgi:hypothetical protein